MREMSRRKTSVSLVLPGLLLFLLSVLFPAGCGTASTTAFTALALPSHYGLEKIATGPDGALWFTDPTGKIERLTIQGQFTAFSVPHPTYTPEGFAGEVSEPTGITAGPDGALWFTDVNFDRIGRISVRGQITMFPLSAGSAPGAITVGPDGALWFTENELGTIGRISVQGQITLFPLSVGSGPLAITAGPDGALWFTEIFRNAKGARTRTQTAGAGFQPTKGTAPRQRCSGQTGSRPRLPPDGLGRPGRVMQYW